MRAGAVRALSGREAKPPLFKPSFDGEPPRAGGLTQT